MRLTCRGRKDDRERHFRRSRTWPIGTTFVSVAGAIAASAAAKRCASSNRCSTTARERDSRSASTTAASTGPRGSVATGVRSLSGAPSWPESTSAVGSMAIRALSTPALSASLAPPRGAHPPAAGMSRSIVSSRQTTPDHHERHARRTKSAFAVRSTLIRRDSGPCFGSRRKSLERFPEDFMFELSKIEFDISRYQSGASSSWGGSTA